MTREELIAKVEGLTGEDANVDALLADYIYGPEKVLDGYGYTGSVDAVLALIQERLPAARVNLYQYADGASWNAVIRYKEVYLAHPTGNAAKPAIALLAATLKALAPRESRSGVG